MFQGKIAKQRHIYLWVYLAIKLLDPQSQSAYDYDDPLTRPTTDKILATGLSPYRLKVCVPVPLFRPSVRPS